MSGYPRVPNNIARVERSQATEEMNPFRAKDAARRHLAGHYQHRTPVAPQYQAAPPQPSHLYEPYCFQPAPLGSYTPVTRSMHPAPLIPKGYAELATSETSMPAQAHGTCQDPYSQSQRNVPRSLIPGYEPLPQLETLHSPAWEIPPVTQPLRRSARNKPLVHQHNQNGDSQTHSRKPKVRLPQAEPTQQVGDSQTHSRRPKVRLPQAEPTQQVGAHSQALALRRKEVEAKDAEERQQASEQQSTTNHNLGQVWQASRQKGEVTDPSVIVSNIKRANERVLVWLENVDEAAFQ